jgi:uncharacterized membrane protein
MTYTQEATPQPQTKTPSSNRINFITAMSAAFAAIAMVLSVRILLLLSVVGAFVLGQVAMTTQSAYSLWVLGIFCAFTVPVLTYLDIQTRRPH